MTASKPGHRVVRRSDIARVRMLLRSGEAARALRIVGDRWTLLILRDAFNGVRRFEDLRRLTGAPRGTLTARLNALVRNGLLYRSLYAQAPQRYEYRLTGMGLDFYPVALMLWAWENRWADAGALPPILLHRPCGEKLQPLQVCAHCRRPVDVHEVGYEAGPGKRYFGPATPATRRRDARPKPLAAGIDRSLFHSIDTLADRWSALLLAALFFGLHRYDHINAAIGIATNILADRLRRLLSAGVVEQHLYRERPVRYEYRLTPKGSDLYHFTVALQEWGARWTPSPHGPALRLRHKPCRHLLSTQVICHHCSAAVDPHEVSVRGKPRRRSRGPARLRYRTAGRRLTG